MTDPDFIPNPTPIPSYPTLPQWPDVVAHVLRTNRRVAAILHEAIPQSATDGKAIIEFKSPIHVTIASQSTAIADALTHVLGGSWEVRCVLLKPRDDGSSLLFAPESTGNRKPKQRRTPGQKYRKDVTPVRPGDVLAVGLDNDRCPVGMVDAANNFYIRLNLYSWVTGEFSAGTAIVRHEQVREFCTLAARNDDGEFQMGPLAAFQKLWTRGEK
ncbi:hypothetical protein ACGFIW_01320 [Micromonospora sp. NPDC048935]|uniref:hypothetical protein n=1 Tax=Micromonospora sp. NPDC048935 TaxID=3364262 RepID=UPI00371525EA